HRPLLIREPEQVRHHRLQARKRPPGIIKRQTLQRIGSVHTLGIVAAVIIGLIAVIGNLLRLWLVPGDVFDAFTYWRTFAAVLGFGIGIGAVAYAINYTKFTRHGGVPWLKTLHTTGWRMDFYDTELNRHVQHARHALAIDENRKDFDRVPWTLPKDEAPPTADPIEADKGVPATVELQENGRVWLKQVWFAGVHSDIGGSYAETEARLSDISLKWMVDEAINLPEPLKIDSSVLHFWPSAAGPQPDERKSTVAGWPSSVVWLLTWIWKREDLGWEPWLRKIPRNAPLHPTVLERFRAPDPGVLHYDVTRVSLQSHLSQSMVMPSVTMAR
ncbi:phospholipase effector Tle1 domain-containing protein, partial [Methylobacterium sp. D54C]